MAMIVRNNFPEFARQLDEHPLSLQRVLHDVLIEYSVQVAKAVCVGNEYGNPNGTPVKTGFARNSWYVEHNDMTITGLPHPGEGTWDTSGTAALSKMVASILSFAAIGAPLHFVNGAEYAIFLEWGHSQRQAPQGMVNLVLRNAQVIMDDIMLRLQGNGSDARRR